MQVEVDRPADAAPPKLSSAASMPDALHRCQDQQQGGCPFDAAAAAAGATAAAADTAPSTTVRSLALDRRMGSAACIGGARGPLGIPGAAPAADEQRARAAKRARRASPAGRQHAHQRPVGGHVPDGAAARVVRAEARAAAEGVGRAGVAAAGRRAGGRPERAAAGPAAAAVVGRLALPRAAGRGARRRGAAVHRGRRSPAVEGAVAAGRERRRRRLRAGPRADRGGPGRRARGRRDAAGPGRRRGAGTLRRAARGRRPGSRLVQEVQARAGRRGLPDHAGSRRRGRSRGSPLTTLPVRRRPIALAPGTATTVLALPPRLAPQTPGAAAR
jgi:hypothetical protein